MNTRNQKIYAELPQEGINISSDSEIVLSKMTLTDRAKYEGFWDISNKLKSHLGIIFEVAHVIPIKKAHESAITHDNLQILVSGIKIGKNDLTWNRLSFNDQYSHIMQCARIIPSADLQYINLILKELALYWD